MKILLTIFAVFLTNLVFAQNITSPRYISLVKKADSLYNAKDYKNSGLAYSSAFKANNDKGSSINLYNAACSWSLANYPDSAFSNLFKAVKANYDDYDPTLVDSDLVNLHKDKRWAQVTEGIKANKSKEEAGYNKPLVAELDGIFTTDQGSRNQLNPVEKKYGRDSKEMHDLWASIIKIDSINLIKVTAILDKYGWLGPDVISKRGNTTLFLVIQHSNIQVRDKYLPMMREAVKNGKASGSQLALMEDRSALEHGKKQIYGSQIGRDEKTGKYYISPIEDEPNVDKRRASVGLGPLSDYAANWGIVYKLPKE